MKNSTDRYCKVYVDTELDRHALTALLAEAMAGAIEDWTVVFSDAEVDVRINPDHNTQRRVEFPDGFLAFRYYLDITTTHWSHEQFVAFVACLLRSLWARAIPAVAACDFESELPNRGGYQSRAVPWPVLNDEQRP